MVVGEEGAVTELCDQVRDDFPAPLDDRPGQPVYVLERPPESGGVPQAASLDDLDALVPAAAEAYREEAGVDAYGRDPALFEWRTRAQIEEGRSWLWREDGRTFKAEASAWTPQAVQLQQVWVEPGLRGRGRRARAGRPVPVPAREDAVGLSLRQPRERTRDCSLRERRHAQNDHLPVAHLRLTFLARHGGPTTHLDRVIARPRRSADHVSELPRATLAAALTRAAGSGH